MRKIIHFMPILFLLLDACVDRLELPILEGRARLVVDGLLTNVKGTHAVKLFTTANMEDPLSQTNPVTNATVKINDDQGNSFALRHTGNGVYSIENFQAETGFRYQLQFSTADGNHYQSSFQLLASAGEVSTITYEFVENAINKSDPIAPHDVFRFYIDAKSAHEATGLFRWRWTAVYEALTFPELKTKAVPGTPPSRAPDPLPCSGWVAQGLTMQQVGPCICCTCWVTEYSEKSLVSNNQLSITPEFFNVQIAQVPIDWKKFQAKYFIKIEQLSLSEDVYEFWKNVSVQQTGTRNLFQPNVIRMKGNITSLTNPNEEVAGIFSVAGSTTTELFIHRKDVPKALVTDTVIDDCRSAYPGSTNVKPSFW